MERRRNAAFLNVAAMGYGKQRVEDARNERHTMKTTLQSVAQAALAALLLAACGGGDTDLSVGQQDISFRLSFAQQPPLVQGGSSAAAINVQDDDTQQTAADAEPFTAPVDLRAVTPLPPGVSVDFSRSPLRAGEAATINVAANANAQAGRHQLLVAGTISGGSTTRFFRTRSR